MHELKKTVGDCQVSIETGSVSDCEQHIQPPKEQEEDQQVTGIN